jgi:hypothetical protein
VIHPTHAESDPGLGRPHFVVTGCARSATTYTARLLSDAGCACTHEAVFGPHTKGFSGWGAEQGDSSWLAVPFLGELPRDTVVVHQVRDPRKAVDALVRFQMFSTGRSGIRQDGVALARYLRGGGRSAVLNAMHPRRRRARGLRRRSDFVGFLREHCPEAFLEPNEVARATRHWVAWNDRIEQTARAADLRYVRVQVEGLDAETLFSVVDLLGGNADRRIIRAALDTVTKEANRQPGGPSSPITRQDLGDVLASAFEAAADRYGYAINVS